MWECVLESTGPVTSRYPQCTAAQWESVSLQHNLLVGVPGSEGLAVDVHHGLLSEEEIGIRYIFLSIVCSTI